jgi:hypothetical protein
MDLKRQTQDLFFLVRPLTDAAEAWGDIHLPKDAPSHGKARAVERKRVLGIVDGMHKAGLTCRKRQAIRRDFRIVMISPIVVKRPTRKDS